MQTIYIRVNDNNRILEWASNPSEGYLAIEVNEFHEVLRNPFIFKYNNGNLIKDEIYQNDLITKEKEIENRPSPQEFLLKQNAFLTSELAKNQLKCDVLANQLSQVILQLAKVTSPENQEV